MHTLISLINSVNQCYMKLSDANNEFCNTKISSEGFQNLVEQRVIISEDIEAIFKTICLHPALSNYNVTEDNSPLKLLVKLATSNNEIAISVNNLKEQLQILVASEKDVEEIISKAKKEIKTEISKLRTGAKKLKGYMQSTTIGSCFINKIK